LKITPVITEKSTKEAKAGNYTFFVDKGLTKLQIKKVIGETFGVHPVRVHTINLPARTKKNYRGRKIQVMAHKKAIVTLAAKEKIDLFETKESKK
jgi:large subunit ribosomal protein L23